MCVCVYALEIDPLVWQPRTAWERTVVRNVNEVRSNFLSFKTCGLSVQSSRRSWHFHFFGGTSLAVASLPPLRREVRRDGFLVFSVLDFWV